MNDITIEAKCYRDSPMYDFCDGTIYTLWRLADSWVVAKNKPGVIVPLFSYDLDRDLDWFLDHFRSPNDWTLEELDHYLKGGEVSDAYDRAMSIL